MSHHSSHNGARKKRSQMFGPSDPTTYQFITAADAENLIEYCQAFVTGNVNLIEAFKGVGINEGFYGFKIAHDDYVNMVSKIGVTTWKVRFGYDPDAEQGEMPFCLIMFGCNSQDEIITPHYMTNNAITQEETIKPPIGIVVPSGLVNPWIEAWENLIISDNVPNDLFRNHSGILRGYNFVASDFLDVLSGHTSASFFYFNFLNHSAAANPPELQPSMAGTFGVSVVGVDKISELNWESVTAFYDISSPCPPAC